MDTLLTSLADLFFTTDFFLYTGMAVWAVIGSAIIMLILIALIRGVVNSVSLGRWSVKSGCNEVDLRLLADVLFNVWRLRSHPIWRPGAYQYRALNGGYWKSAFDYADNGRVTRDRMLADIARQRADIAAAAETAAADDTQSIPSVAAV